jgi:hypothetical protein
MMPRTGEIGEQIFDQVEKLVADGMNRTEAFAKISADTGRRAGTVAANYYRVARKRAGGSLRPRGRAKAATSRRRVPATTTASRGNGRRRRTAAQSGGGDIDRIADALVGNIEQLTAAVKSQSREVAELRSRLDGIRRLLD